MKTVTIIGMGLAPRDLTAEHLEIIEAADILIGGKRLLDYFEQSSAQKKTIDKNVKGVIDFVKKHDARRRLPRLSKRLSDFTSGTL